MNAAADFFTNATARQVLERYLTREEERKLLSHVKRHAGHYARRDHAWMRLLRFTGVRVGALSQLTVGDARAALQLGRLRMDDDISKGQRGYDVPLSLPAREALEDLLAVRRAMKCPDVPDGPLVCARSGAALSVRSFEHRMQLWRQSAGLQVNASPHWWRHTLGQRIREKTTAQDPQSVIQIALGHRSRSSTNIYTLPTREEVARALQEGAF